MQGSVWWQPRSAFEPASTRRSCPLSLFSLATTKPCHHQLQFSRFTIAARGDCFYLYFALCSKDLRNRHQSSKVFVLLESKQAIAFTTVPSFTPHEITPWHQQKQQSYRPSCSLPLHCQQSSPSKHSQSSSRAPSNPLPKSTPSTETCSINEPSLQMQSPGTLEQK